MIGKPELNRKFVFKRRNSSEAGICTPHHIMIMGTSVLQGANADYRQLFLASDLLSKLKFYDPSISNFDERKCVITTNNGDGNAAAIHFLSLIHIYSKHLEIVTTQFT